MMSLTFGLSTQVSDSGPQGPLDSASYISTLDFWVLGDLTLLHRVLAVLSAIGLMNPRHLIFLS